MNKKKISIAIIVGIIIVGTLFVGTYMKKSDNQNSSYKLTEDTTKKENEKNEIKAKIDNIEKNLSETHMILVNKDNKLDSKFVPNELIKSSIPFQQHIETRNLDKIVSEAAQKMFDDAKKEGINLLGASGYRAYDIQNRIYNDKVKKVGQAKAEEYLAPPGASEHQTGYAIDIVSTEYSILDDGFEKTKAFKWLIENCDDYGFILRYDKDKVDITKYMYEPWHYRYVGVENAQKIMDSNLCFEEYIEKQKKEIEELKEKLNAIS